MRGKDAGNHSYPDYLDLRDRNRSFDELVAYGAAVAGVDTGGDPSSAWVELVTGNYFDGLRLQPYLGRLTHSSDEHGVNSAPYIVLSYAYWRPDRCAHASPRRDRHRAFSCGRALRCG